MTTLIQKENAVTGKLTFEVIGFTDMNKDDIQAAIQNAIQCQLIFTKSNGETFELKSYFEPQVENLTIEEE